MRGLVRVHDRLGQTIAQADLVPVGLGPLPDRLHVSAALGVSAAAGPALLGAARLAGGVDRGYTGECDLLGHAQVETTQIYTAVPDGARRAAVAAAAMCSA